MSAMVDGKLILFFDRCAEVLLQVQLGANRYAIKAVVGQRTLQLSLLHIFHCVVRDQVMRDTVQGNAHGLLDKTIRSEAIAVNKRADELTLHLFLAVSRARGGRFGFRRIRRRRGCWGESVVLGDFVLLGFTTAFGFLRGSFAFHCSLLLAGREGFLEFAVDQKVSKDATGAPGDTICPTLDARSILFVDKDTSALDQACSLTIVRTTRYMVKLSAQTGFEEDKSIHAVLDESMPCRLEWSRTRATAAHSV